MRGKSFGLLIGIGVVVVGITAGVISTANRWGFSQARAPFVPSLDTRGPYVLAMTEAAERTYGGAIAEARKLHADAGEVVFAVGDLRPVEALFRRLQPRYAMVFILPDELDANFASKWLRLTIEVDDDPFVDVRTGFITGEDPAAAARFVRRIRAAVENKTPLPGLALDDLGPNPMAPKDAFFQNPGTFMIPVLAERLAVGTISHGTNGFGSERLGNLDNAGLIHFGGHGFPDRVEDGITGAQAGRLKLSPCVVFNGACYTGVPARWFDLRATVAAREVAPEESFCLSMLANNVLGYFAALGPDHGLPVYQEMEFLATDGGLLGDIIKHTHDGVMLAGGGKPPAVDSFRDGMGRPQWSPAEFMLKGTASRVLFGDPALQLTAPFAAPAFEVRLQPEGADTLRLTATLQNAQLKATFTDTYFSDLSSVPNLFNDRALIRCRLPAGWDDAQPLDGIQVTAKGTNIKARLQGYAVEKEAGIRWLHIQLDLPTRGYMQSDFRVTGAQVELRLRRKNKLK